MIDLIQNSNQSGQDSTPNSVTELLSLKPIGIIHSCYPDKFGTPRQSLLVSEASAEIRILPEYQPQFALEGLVGFSHLWLIWGFHRNSNLIYRPKVHPPRAAGRSLGVFATRSPHRPNPLGLSLVKIEKVESPRIFVTGIDLVDGTPIYDVKPYLPSIEALPQAEEGWTQAVPESEPIEIEWTPECLALVEDWSLRASRPYLKNLIEETLRQDPRPLIYRGYEGSEDTKYRTRHAVRIHEGDIHFSFVTSNRIRVQSLSVSMMA